MDEALERSVLELEAQLRNKEQEKQELTEQIDQTLVVIAALEGGMRGQEREYLGRHTSAGVESEAHSLQDQVRHVLGGVQVGFKYQPFSHRVSSH